MQQTVELIEPEAKTLSSFERAQQHPIAVAQQQPAPIAGADATTHLLQMAVQRGASMDEIRELVQLRREIREDEERERQRRAVLAFRQAFANFKAENIVVPKTKLVQQRSKSGGAGPSYMQSEFHVVANLLQPALARHGFGYRFTVTFERGSGDKGPWCKVICKLEHREGHVEELMLEGPPDNSGAKNPLQEMQSSATFLMRHALLAITGTAQEGADNDGRGARGYRDDGDDTAGGTSEGDAEVTRLKAEGEARSVGGMDDLTGWWGKLSEPQRRKLTPLFADWKKAAQNFDRDGSRR
jgi:hypothetical protein